MKHGDISNHVSSLNIGVRLNGFLVDLNRQNIFQKARYSLGGKISPWAIDPSVSRFVESLFYGTSCTVDLVYVGKAESEAARFIEAARDVPHNRVHLVEDLYGAERLLYGGVLSHFVTMPLDVGRMSGEHAHTIERFNSMLKKSLK